MRKAQKSQIEDFLHLLNRAHEGIKRSIETGQKDSALDLLSQCQDGAIQIGEMIESIEGEGFITVSYLEDYCESVYQIYESVRQNQKQNPNKIFKHLRTFLTQVKNSVKNDIKVRKEAVFLPYKASMWDSLESVFKAADEDPDCDAYVIPIPYFDKNPDGSFREEHYEGDLYPKDIPITRYEDYDFENRQPDLIFIHNPYDECNYVTSVHPFFYSKNLKQFTEQLVYIPYFILDEIDPENPQAVEGMKHFCTVPAVIYADKVIVQSEDMRKIYVNVMTEYAKGSKADRKYWEAKILGLGSPKVDKVLRTKKEELEIPEEWLKVIEKEDGSWKKVIFYNTSVTALLEHGEKMLVKMRDVFRVFRENVEEVALLWRPHPLIQATIESMRAELWEEYRELVKVYKEEGWGIYDDTADLDRAIALCDGYYGDHSSVVKLCQEAGKAVMVQNVGVLGNDNYIKISFEDFIIDDQTIMFPMWDYDQICIYNIKEQITKNIQNYKSSNMVNKHLYSRICRYKKDKYLFTPLYSDKILLYDSSSQTFNDIMVKNVKCDGSCLFFENVIYGKYIFLIPGNYDAIIRFDSDTEDIKYYKEWINILKEKKPNNSCVYFRHGFGLIENILCLSYKSTNYILKINLSTEFAEIIETDKKFGTCESICADNQFCWIITSKGVILKLNIQDNSIYVLNKIEVKMATNDVPYSEIISYKNKLYLIPYGDNKIVEIHKKTFEIIVINIPDITFIRSGLFCLCAKVYRDKLYIYSLTLKKMLVIDLNNYKIDGFFIYADVNDFVLQSKLSDLEYNFNISKKVYEERLNGLLQSFLNSVCFSIKRDLDYNYVSKKI